MIIISASSTTVLPSENCWSRVAHVDVVTMYRVRSSCTLAYGPGKAAGQDCKRPCAGGHHVRSSCTQANGSVSLQPQYKMYFFVCF